MRFFFKSAILKWSINQQKIHHCTQSHPHTIFHLRAHAGVIPGSEAKHPSDTPGWNRRQPHGNKFSFTHTHIGMSVQGNTHPHAHW